MKLVTIYGTGKLEPDDVPGMLANRKIVHPLLLDPTEAYRKALGLESWPLATLLDEEGRVVWQGATGRKGFAAACEERIEALLAAKPEAGASSGASSR